jgi:hypothetical protein
MNKQLNDVCIFDKVCTTRHCDWIHTVATKGIPQRTSRTQVPSFHRTTSPSPADSDGLKVLDPHHPYGGRILVEMLLCRCRRHISMRVEPRKHTRRLTCEKCVREIVTGLCPGFIPNTVQHKPDIVVCSHVHGGPQQHQPGPVRSVFFSSSSSSASARVLHFRPQELVL